jgi:hypothetical protein
MVIQSPSIMNWGRGERRRIEPGDDRRHVVATEALSAKQRGQRVKVFTRMCFQQKEEVASAYLGTKAFGLVQGELISASGEEGVHEVFRKILGEHRELTNF